MNVSIVYRYSTPKSGETQTLQRIFRPYFRIVGSTPRSACYEITQITQCSTTTSVDITHIHRLAMHTCIHFHIESKFERSAGLYTVVDVSAGKHAEYRDRMHMNRIGTYVSRSYV